MSILRLGLGLLVLLPCLANAQPKNNPFYDLQKLHFGFTIGTHLTDFRYELSDEFLNNDTLLRLDVDQSAGFNLGAVMDYHITEELDVRFIPTLTLSSRSMISVFDRGNREQTVSKEVTSTYVEVPLMLKYKSKRLGNFRFFVLGGGKFSYDFGSDEGSEQGPEQIPQLKTITYLYEYGLGVDIYLQYFKFTPQVKFSRSLTNALVDNDDPISRSLEAAYPRFTYISFFFE
jgi:hypothetical protein